MLPFWLRLLVGFFALPVNEKVPGEDEPEPEPEPEEEPQPELNLENVEEEQIEEPEADPAAELAAEKTARAAAEARAEQYQRDLEQARQGTRQVAPTSEQKLHEQEESKLADPKTTDLERWQIQSNRTIRRSEAKGTAALAQAHDLADRTAFRQLEVTKPAIFKRYEKRVEEELGKMRAGGANASREAILRFLIGADAMEGKLAPSKKKDDDAGVKRGKLPGARSDVRAKGGMSDAEKREARLVGVRL